MQLQLIDSIESSFTSMHTDNALLIKGFASTNVLDREREFVDSPLEFDLNTFQNSPQLLLDHDYIKTPEGNSVAAGKVSKTIPAYIKGENPYDNSQWLVYSILDNEFVSVWEKSKSPLLEQGDRGLFVVAEVTNVHAIDLINRGELAAFSWKGLAIAELLSDGTKKLKQIDLIEISVVHTQCERCSTFVITDEEDPTVSMEVNLKDCDIYRVKFNKDQYQLETIKEYAKKFNTDTSKISENDSGYYVEVGEPSLVDVVNSFQINVGTWNFIAAPKKKMMNNVVPRIGKLETETISESNMSENIAQSEKIESEVELPAIVAEKFYLLDVDLFKKLNPSAKVSLQKELVLGEMPVEIHFIEMTEATKTVAELEAPEAIVADEVEASVAAEVPAEKEDESKLDKLMAIVEGLVTDRAIEKAKQEEEAAKALALAHEAAKTEEAAKTAEQVKAELAKEVEAQFQQMKEAEKSLQAQKEELSKQLDRIASFSGAVPEKTERSDKVSSEKSFGTTSDTLDSVGFFAGQILKGLN